MCLKKKKSSEAYEVQNSTCFMISFAWDSRTGHTNLWWSEDELPLAWGWKDYLENGMTEFAGVLETSQFLIPVVITKVHIVMKNSWNYP